MKYSPFSSHPRPLGNWSWKEEPLFFQTVITLIFILFLFYKFVFWLHHATCGILVLQQGIEPRPIAMKVLSLNQWTTRELPPSLFFLELCGSWQNCARVTGGLLHKDPIELRSFVLGPSWWQLTPLWSLESEDGLTVGVPSLLYGPTRELSGRMCQLCKLRLEASLFLLPHGPSPLQ